MEIIPDPYTLSQDRQSLNDVVDKYLASLHDVITAIRKAGKSALLGNISIQHFIYVS